MTLWRWSGAACSGLVDRPRADSGEASAGVRRWPPWAACCAHWVCPHLQQTHWPFCFTK